MKPLGIEMTYGNSGLGMCVTKPNTAVDSIWQAVEDAIDANMTPQQFMSEVRKAWDQSRRDQNKADMAALSKQL